MVRVISRIRDRKPHYTDSLEERRDGQNIYHLVGHSRSQVQLHGHVGADGKLCPPKQIHVDLPAQTLIPTVPYTNLSERKKAVLSIFKENLRFVNRLRDIKGH